MVSSQTLSWTAPAAPAGETPAEGLRERKKRLMRQQLSDTATRMFMEHGFDAVRVADVAEACGVSEKTVFNYFPTKESLVLDRLEATVASLRTGLADPEVPPVEAALAILDRELGGMTGWLAGQDDPGRAAATMRRFGDLIRATPSLRAYQSDMMDQFASVATQILAARAEMSPDDPEPEEEFRAPIRAQYETQGHPWYSTARLWDDGVIDPVDTRMVLALGLSAALNAEIPATSFGVFRM